MLELFADLFSYSFMSRAMIVGVLVALCSALLGVSLVLKRYSMIGDGLSHVGFGALSVAVAIAAFLLLRINSDSRIKGDAAIALISSSALAIGVIVTSLTTGLNADVHNYLFGSILAMSESDVVLSISLSVLVLLLFIVFYHRLFAVTFDESFARATGTRCSVYNMLLALLTAITIVVGMRIMGAMLISSLVIFPALTSMRVCRSFRGVILCSAVISVLCFFLGMFASYVFSTPAGASVVVVNLAAFLLFSLVGKCRRV